MSMCLIEIYWHCITGIIITKMAITSSEGNSVSQHIKRAAWCYVDWTYCWWKDNNPKNS